MKNKVDLPELAVPTDEVYMVESEKCFESIFYLFRDNKCEFFVGLRDLLKCLSFAESQGEIPMIQTDW